MVYMGWMESESNLVKNPVAAIYTPFSFILIYEVYLLIYYLPKSITNYVGKQYEIITLILIRRLFKDLSELELSSNWFEIKSDMQFTYDVLGCLVLFYLIFLFYRENQKKYQLAHNLTDRKKADLGIFIKIKKILATILVPVLLIIASNRLYHWWMSDVSFKNINNIFFDEFFTILIVADVILLLTSFYSSDQFHKIIRNSGFIISTILIRLSFSVEGIINTILIVCAVLFGLLILVIHNQFEKGSKKDVLIISD
jgi:hypothetical protein